MPKIRREPVRTCVACRLEAGKASLARLVRDAGGQVRLDPGGRAPGRGAYLHRDPACIGLARRRKILERALKGAVPESAWAALEA